MKFYCHYSIGTLQTPLLTRMIIRVSEASLHVLITLVSLTGLLISLLFEVTALEFSLNHQHSSFLDETWIIPVIIGRTKTCYGNSFVLHLILF